VNATRKAFQITAELLEKGRELPALETRDGPVVHPSSAIAAT
jgi:hypothetical protein